MSSAKKIWIPHRPIDIILFLLLAFLCYQAHQLTRHLVGAALCGGFGTMTFTVATTREPCSLPTVVVLSGPVLTYGLAYLGVVLLRSPRAALFAYGLIFASFSHLRFIQNLTGRGDELILTAPMVWRNQPRRRRRHRISDRPAPRHRRLPASLPTSGTGRVFAASLLLPLPVLIVLLFGSTLLFEKSKVGEGFG